jgi:hypothetical protein
MADIKTPKPTPKAKSEYGKPASGSFRVVSFTYKGKGRNREKIIQQVDIKKNDAKLTEDSKSLLEIYKLKAENPNSKVLKVIE